MAEQDNLWAQSTSGTASHITAAVTADSQSRPPLVGAYTSSGSSATFAPEDVTYMNPTMKQAMSVMMREAKKVTASASVINPQRQQEYGYPTEDGSGDSSDDSEEEMPTSESPSWESQPPAQPYPAYSAMAAFGSAAIASSSAPVFSTINGPFTKVDNRHHIMNIASGNTNNTLIEDSYNDDSVQTFEPSECA